jgi:hypothetical protein
VEELYRRRSKPEMWSALFAVSSRLAGKHNCCNPAIARFDRWSLSTVAMLRRQAHCLRRHLSRVHLLISLTFSAGGRHNSIHAQIRHHLSVMIESVRDAKCGQMQTSSMCRQEN